MSLPHFFAGAPEPGERVVLRDSEARHALRSLRLTAGDRFTSSDGRGAIATCVLVRTAGDELEAEVETRDVAARPEPTLAVMVSAPKGERLTWAVQKLTEIGTDEIVVVETARSVRRFRGDRARILTPRLEAVATEAAKQSRRAFLPVVSGPIPWEVAVRDALSAGPTIVLWEAATAPLAEVLPDRAERVSLAIGPEGGLEEPEVRKAENKGAILGSLGRNILRTETAAVVAAALALSRFGRLG
ncbi:MAG: RsmE family RNA methyltransferase [Actinomycetota bacterium]